MDVGPIRFPHLGFEVLVNKSFTIFGFEIAYYGVIMALSMVCGAIVAYCEAKRTGQKVDDYIDYTLFGIVGGIICARLYYVIFEWDYYSENLSQIFNLRGGGIAIYGGIIGAVIVAVIFCKVKKMKFFKFADTAVLGLVTGQIIGRWGNFFNREAFGSYTDGLFAMQIPLSDIGGNVEVTDAMKVIVSGVEYVQVQPTFLYESALNLVLLILLIIFRDKKKFYGETFCRYLMGYGVIRFIIEGFRTDQLQFRGVAVSQILSAVLFVAALAFVIVMRVRLKGKPSQIDPIPPKKKKIKSDAAGEDEDAGPETEQGTSEEPESGKDITEADAAGKENAEPEAVQEQEQEGQDENRE